MSKTNISYEDHSQHVYFIADAVSNDVALNFYNSFAERLKKDQKTQKHVIKNKNKIIEYIKKELDPGFRNAIVANLSFQETADLMQNFGEINALAYKWHQIKNCWSTDSTSKWIVKTIQDHEEKIPNPNLVVSPITEVEKEMLKLAKLDKVIQDMKTENLLKENMPDDMREALKPLKMDELFSAYIIDNWRKTFTEAETQAFNRWHPQKCFNVYLTQIRVTNPLQKNRLGEYICKHYCRSKWEKTKDALNTINPYYYYKKRQEEKEEKARQRLRFRLGLLGF